MKPLTDVQCPCCQEWVPLEGSGLGGAGRFLKFCFESQDPDQLGVDEAIARKLQWACAECLGSGKATAGDPTAQTYCDFSPYLAYFDVRLPCRECARSFVFSAREQRHWYEVLKFYVQSRPVRCLECRASKRRAAAVERNRQLHMNAERKAGKRKRDEIG